MRLPLRFAALLVTAGTVALTVQSHRAFAGWPPVPGDDLTDPNNWPNDPGYKDRWNYWSFLPKQATGTPAYLDADKTLGASGMSIDKAWELTIGRRDVKIAVLDSGIEWDANDLANKEWLNPAELKGTHKPRDKSGQPCAGSGPLTGYDCNGDGIFNVADYRDDPRIAPPDPKGQVCLSGMDPQKPTTTIRITGDRNANCLLDAGDIIELFSDGVDDDPNGFTDDISGWDFYHNDNNAYDDPRYGHGTGRANDSLGEGNNNIDSIGTCPNCTFIPIRVGNSFIADANDFALAVVYATDNGAKVIQESLGTLDQTAFSRAAIDYAYAHGVTLAASMADENSRHHNMPSTANHDLTVHTVRYNGQAYGTSSTFLAYDTCSDFGGNLGLSVAGTGCSSEAGSRSGGIAGLIVSKALSLPQPINLTAEEVIQTFKATADDINVVDSQNLDPTTGLGPFYDSKLGWDQRFGYGRVNASRALALVQSGLIPPEVDIVSPAWYAPIYADRVSGPVPIMGRIAAARARSYDYVVEAAAGIEPDDAAFKPLGAAVNNVPGATVTGGATVPLGSFDARTIQTPFAIDPNPDHPPDVDSPRHCNDARTFCWGPNDKTVTIRVRATAHYPSGDVKGEARRTVSVTNQTNGLDEDLLPGFPLDLGSSMEGSAKLADIDGDGVRDIVIASSDGSIHALSLTSGLPRELAGFPVHTAPHDGVDPAPPDPSVPSYLSSPAFSTGKDGHIDPGMVRETIISAPAIADMNGDGKPEIVFSSWPGTIYVVDHVGQSLSGWPKRLPLVPSCPLDPAAPKPATDCNDLRHDWTRGTYAAPVTVDMNKDGKLDIVQAAFDGSIYVFNADGSVQPGWPVRLHTTRTDKYNRIMTTPTVADLNGDTIPDLVSGSNEEIGGGGGTGPVFAVDGRGMKAPGGPYLHNWPFVRTSVHILPVVAEGIDSAMAAADFDGDGVADIAVQGNLAPPMVVRADPGPQSGLDDPPNLLPVREDDAGTTKGFVPASIFGQLVGADGPLKSHVDIASDTMFPVFSSPSIGDLDQDGVPDLVMSGGSLSILGNILGGGGPPKKFQYLLTAWSGKTGKMMDGLPIVLEDMQFLINHAIADIDGDNYPEIITGSGVYFLHAANACGREPVGWPKFTNGWLASSPAVGDITGDGMLDVVAASREGYLFAWKTKGPARGVVQWESFHHDNQNTGNYMNPLDQGVLRGTSKVIDCTPPAVPRVDSFDVGGGCDCRASGGGGTWVGPLLGLMAVLVRRARARRSLQKAA